MPATPTPLHRSIQPPEPALAPERGSLAHPLTFFLSADERGAVLGALRRFHRDRAAALKIALGVQTPPLANGGRP